MRLLTQANRSANTSQFSYRSTPLSLRKGHDAISVNCEIDSRLTFICDNKRCWLPCYCRWKDGSSADEDLWPTDSYSRDEWYENKLFITRHITFLPTIVTGWKRDLDFPQQTRKQSEILPRAKPLSLEHQFHHNYSTNKSIKKIQLVTPQHTQVEANKLWYDHSGVPNVNFWKRSVRKTIWDLEFLEHLL